MSQNGFAGGFIAGAFVGGIIGGVVGVLASNRLRSDEADNDFSQLSSQLSEEERRRLENATTEERMEIARRGLEDKISQLNMAIEDVRVQMSTVNNGHDYSATEYGGAHTSERDS